ncbi:hypothetical protein [Rhizobium sp. IBUN]|uniref:hypothetical protein n=1 Tax=Rhizobium sp. IBUN TaxID=1042326 RepID=UPI000A0177C7|nr:hypothetical protein [Rhizobium sp. IBUN]
MKPSIFVVGLPLLVGGCASTPPDVIASADVQQTYTVRAIQHRSPISGFAARQPVDPKPWRQQNEQLSPKNGGDMKEVASGENGSLRCR